MDVMNQRVGSLLVVVQAVLVLVTGPVLAESPPLPIPGCSAWEQVSPLPQGNDLNAVVFSGGRFVAVGEETAVWSDGEEPWSSGFMPELQLTGVAGDGHDFIAVGAGGAMVRWVEGGFWDWIPSPTTDDLLGIAWGDGIWVTFSVGSVWISGNGSSWIDAGVHVPTSLAGVTFSEESFQLWGNAGLLFESYDGGQNWIDQTVPTTDLITGAVRHGDVLVAATSRAAFRASDGAAWEHVARSGGVLKSLVWAGATYVACIPTERLVTSKDGLAWIEIPGSPTAVHALAWSGNQLTAVGARGQIWSSPDGSTWQRESGPHVDYSSVIWTGTEFVATAREGTYSSTDGTSWTLRSVEGGGHLVWDGVRLVVFGDRVLASLDLAMWQSFPALPATPIDSALWDGHRYVVAAGGNQWCPVLCPVNPMQVLTSVDLESWDSSPAGELVNGPSWLATDGETYVLTSESGFLTSTGLGTWTPLEVGGPIPVTWAARRFVATGNGKAYVSTNGRNWLESEAAETLGASHLVWTGSAFLAIGTTYKETGAEGFVASSGDGLRWTRHGIPEVGRLVAAAASDTVLVVVGGNGTVLRSSCREIRAPRRHIPR